ncbi:nuclear transport factor 2 family protein [Blastococcus sp. URHD0036]|uniref:nuclear transport factor 2 family protein n=1 Tax=Blastococcus sp. URHD0036 TaxID=1380356 RepID=UPI000495DFA8|nr:nuclear transport factor 2 family protein [Blastococcus sp. URHD0036]
MDVEEDGVVRRWHAAVNAGNTAAAMRTVTDPVVVSGPRGAGRVPAEEFVAWIERSRISMDARRWHPVGARVTVVEQHATWPEDPEGAEIATCFVTAGERVCAALRYPSAQEALQVASALAEVLALESGLRP